MKIKETICDNCGLRKTTKGGRYIKAVYYNGHIIADTFICAKCRKKGLIQIALAEEEKRIKKIAHKIIKMADGDGGDGAEGWRNGLTEFLKMAYPEG